MSLILIISIGIRLVAMVWAIVLLRRIRDWRMALLTVMLGLMAMRQALTLLAEKESWAISAMAQPIELPGLAVSILAFLVVVFLGRLIRQEVEAREALRKHREHLEELIKERTVNLTKTNDQLQQEIIERNRAEEEIQQRADELAELYEIGRDLAAILDQDVLLPAIAQRVTDTLRADRCAIFLFDERTQVLRARAAHGYMEERLADFSSRPVDEVVDLAYATREPQYVPDLDLVADLPRRNAVCATLAVPLMSPTDSPLGVLSVASLRPDAFTPNQQRLLETMAGQIAVAIEKSRLLEQQQVEARRLRTLNELMMGIVGARALDRTLDAIAQAIVDLLGCDMAAVALYDPVADEIRIPVEYGHRGFSRAFVEQFRLAAGSGAGGKAFSEGRVNVIPDTRAKGMMIDHVQADRAGIRAMMVGPLQTPERKLGVLYANQRCPYSFGKDEVALFSMLAGQAALAIESAHLYKDLEHRACLLQEANIRLQELDQLKSMFIASMSHELRTPLNSIIGFTGIILQGLTGEINAEQRDQLQRVYGSAKHLLSLINELIDISKIEAGKLDVHTEKFDLDGVIKEAVSNLASEINKKGLDIEISVPQDIRLTTDRKRVLQCLLNYVSNAVKFSEKGKIRIVAREGDKMVEIRVEDTGIGIREEDIPDLFTSFVRLDSPLKTKAPGTGLGLYLTKKIATELLEGTVSVESEYGKGSTFVLKIPRQI